MRVDCRFIAAPETVAWPDERRELTFRSLLPRQWNCYCGHPAGSPMKQLQPVIWSKGTFLTPQHLQVQDRFIEDSLNFRLQSLKYCAWGFSELTVDQERLAEGQFLVSRAAGIFPDGLF